MFGRKPPSGGTGVIPDPIRDLEIEALKLRVEGLESAIKQLLDIMRLHTDTVSKLSSTLREMVDRMPRSAETLRN